MSFEIKHEIIIYIEPTLYSVMKVILQHLNSSPSL